MMKYRNIYSEPVPENPAWQIVESHWPAPLGANAPRYMDLQHQIAVILRDGDIPVVRFSHFGVVVNNLSEALTRLMPIFDQPAGSTRQDWVAAYHVHVSRFRLEGIELELLEPAGDSFFSDFLNSYGPALQHLSFEVVDIHQALRRIETQGALCIDKTPRQGAHGKVAFWGLEQFHPLYIEFCQLKE